MFTKIVMTASAVLLSIAGITLIFLPAETIKYLGIPSSAPLILLSQISGALYFAFAILNWMVKESLIGGIYNKPIVVANLTHFLIVGLTLIKVLMNHPGYSYKLWIIAIIYALLAILFSVLFYRHPLKETSK